MRNLLVAAIGVSAALAMAAPSASAAEASASTCLSLASQVKTALAANPHSANYEQAVKENRYGQNFCLNSMPKVGTAHYAQALKLLGVS